MVAAVFAEQELEQLVTVDRSLYVALSYQSLGEPRQGAERPSVPAELDGMATLEPDPDHAGVGKYG